MIDFSEIIPQLTPDVLIETDWLSGRSGQPTDQKKLVLLGHKTATGAAAAGAVKRITSRAQAIVDFGQGSELACMAEAALKISPRIPLFAVAYVENVAGVQASGTVAITGTKATKAGTFAFTVAGRTVQIGIAVDDTPTIVGGAIAAALTALPNCPVTSANVTGTVTQTARNKGTAGNTIRQSYKLTGADGLTFVVAAVLAGGLTDGDPETVLTGLEGDRYHLIAFNLFDATTLGKLKADREQQSGVSIKKWGLGLCGFVGTEANAETLASGLDTYRMQICWHQESPQPVFELAARFGAERALRAANVSLDDVQLRGITPAVDETKWPNAADIEAALAAGVTPIRPLRNGTCEIVRSVVARTTSPAFIDSMAIEISDYADEFAIALLGLRAKGKRLKTGSAPGTPSTMTPSKINTVLNEAYYKLDRQDYLQGVEKAIKDGVNFAEVNAVDPNRVDGARQFWPIAFAHLIAVKKQYVTEG
jgi:phage tail sheath gpL-like